MRDGMLIGAGMAVGAALGLFVVGAARAAPGPDITGTARIVDGDTVEVAGTKIRLAGIDAPESDQVCFTATGGRDPCGVRARDALVARFGDRPWTCRGDGVDRYGRTLGTCTVDGEDVGRWAVRAGHALAFVRYAHTYDADETAARAARAGVWAGCLAAPWDWRKRDAQTVLLGHVCPVGAQADLLSPLSAAAAPDPACTIKGNTNRDGECIYHRPGDRFYARVRMTPGPGKRWFCTTAEAEAAGCRASKV